MEAGPKTWYHCSQPIEDQHISDYSASYRPRCYAAVAKNESCWECGGVRPDVFVATEHEFAPIHASCVADRNARLAGAAR